MNSDFSAPLQSKLRGKKYIPYTPITYCYLRRSTLIQENSFETQLNTIKQYCSDNKIPLDEKNILEDSVTGKKRWTKRKIGELLDCFDGKLATTDLRLKPSDILICYDISRVGRNMFEIAEIANTCLQKNIHFHSVKNKLKITNDIQDKIVVMALSIAAEVERNNIAMRTKDSLKTIKERKTFKNSEKKYEYKGICGEVRCVKFTDDNGEEQTKQILRKGTTYKKKLDKFKDEIIKEFKEGATKTSLATKYNVSWCTMSSFIDKNKDE